jgi:hypothetical protein
MKKIIFLLLMVVLAGFVFAGTSNYPPWDSSDNTAARNPLLAEYNVQQGVVTLSTVLTVPLIAELSSFPAVMAYYDFIAVLPQRLVFNKTWETPEFYLRC